MTFDLTTVLTVLVTCGSMAAGLLFAHRQSGRGIAFGAVAWRLVLLVTGAVVGLGTAHAYDDLVRHGWQPAELGSAWSYPFGELMVRAAMTLDVAPLVIPADSVSRTISDWGLCRYGRYTNSVGGSASQRSLLVFATPTIAIRRSRI